MTTDISTQKQNCYNCKNKRRKDFFYYVCSIEGRVITPDESCERWEEEEERDFYGC